MTPTTIHTNHLRTCHRYRPQKSTRYATYYSSSYSFPSDVTIADSPYTLVKIFSRSYLLHVLLRHFQILPLSSFPFTCPRQLHIQHLSTNLPDVSSLSFDRLICSNLSTFNVPLMCSFLVLSFLVTLKENPRILSQGKPLHSHVCYF